MLRKGSISACNMCFKKPLPGPPRGGGGGGGTGILPQGPQTFKGPHEAFIFTFVGCIFTLFRYVLLSRHCLDSMSEHLYKIISNAFMETLALMRVFTMNTT